MRLATFINPSGQECYGVVTPAGIIDLKRRLGGGYPDLKSVIAKNGLDQVRRHLADQPDHSESEVAWLPVIPNPDKIVCIGLNYEDHRIEAGLESTEHPALFLRTAASQTGHRGPIVRPRESGTLDYEAEIAVIIGRPGRRIPRAAAWNHIAGYSCYNDGSIREWQRHTRQYTAGKNFSQTGGFGPWMTTSDEIPPGTVLGLSCRLNGEVVQQSSTDQMIFSIPVLIEYISAMTALAPGDVIVTGTPAGVGSRRTPPIWMKPGDKVEVEVEKVGVLENVVVDD
uniref:fumarylacetoacetate hydrolase family protein n=1 Tax=Actinomadura sp. CA-154981 TaxID=3240037 RepID=UPI003F493A76